MAIKKEWTRLSEALGELWGDLEDFRRELFGSPVEIKAAGLRDRVGSIREQVAGIALSEAAQGAAVGVLAESGRPHVVESPVEKLARKIALAAGPYTVTSDQGDAVGIFADGELARAVAHAASLPLQAGHSFTVYAASNLRVATFKREASGWGRYWVRPRFSTRFGAPSTEHDAEVVVERPLDMRWPR